MDVFILAGQSNMAGRGGVQRLPDGRTSFACSKESSAVTTIGRKGQSTCTESLHRKNDCNISAEPVRLVSGRLLSFDERQGWQPAIEPIHVNVDNR